MTIARIMGKIVKFLPKTEGAAGKITLGRAQLTQIAQQDQKAAKVIEKLIEKTTNPKLDIAYKAESNYAIAGLKLRDGKKVVANGAVSITNPGSNSAVVKYRASVDGGKTLQANGFLDGGKVADGKDIAVSLSRKGGKVKGDLEIGQATGHHVEFVEQEAVDLAKALDSKYFLQGYANATNKLQRNLDRVMCDLRTGLRGETPPVKFPISKGGYVKVAEALEPNAVKLKTIDIDKFNKFENKFKTQVGDFNPKTGLFE